MLREAPSLQPPPSGGSPSSVQGPGTPGPPTDGPVAHPGPPTPPQASPLTLAQLGPKEGLPSRAKAELTAQDAGGDEVPPVVTDCAPLAVQEHFHSALTHLGPRAEAHLWLLLGENQLQGGLRRRDRGWAMEGATAWSSSPALNCP